MLAAAEERAEEEEDDNGSNGDDGEKKRKLETFRKLSWAHFSSLFTVVLPPRRWIDELILYIDEKSNFHSFKADKGKWDKVNYIFVDVDAAAE